MKLWFLEDRSEELPDNDNPWADQWDMTFSMVVRASSAQRAREIAQKSTMGKESSYVYGDDLKRAYTRAPWLDEKYSTCVELTLEGEEGCIIENFNAG